MATDMKLITVAELIALLQALPQDSVHPMFEYKVGGVWDRVTIWFDREQKGNE